MTCEICERQKAKIIISQDEEQKQLCLGCYNRQLSAELNVELQSQPEAFSTTDYAGVRREFIITQRLNPVGILIEAEEKKEYGYKFAVHGELDCDQVELFQRLQEKVKQGITTSYVTTRKFPSGQQVETIKNDKIVGRLDYDELNEDTPMVVIDGKPYTWEQLGKMVQAFEGFQIKVKMVDMTDNVE
ncbi:DUF7713 domain-containing protein [Alkalihalobacillus deserti]|uniref:DUF7713 domain-containing protein n=1 Tax=Alkalihalobacillus deserti TaxID=2879466 RepID=UPI001D14FC28|nr:hypothetical protein [Alkalihalobacillus deserti]